MMRRVKPLLLVVCPMFLLACSGGDDPPPPPEFELTVISFNTGTTDGLGHDDPPDDGYSSEQALVSDTYYGNGLAWIPAVEAATRFLATAAPDIIAFQEIFDSEECAMIPPEAHADFVCETWVAGDPTVANVILGAGYQVACNLDKSDKCLAVKRSFGAIRGCDADICRSHLEGTAIDGCSSSGSRIGRGVVDLVGGGSITVVAVHASSGITLEDAACRVRQFDQVFVDLGLGDGPAANGDVNIILGDFNTDPVRLADGDESAARVIEFVGDGLPFHFINDVGRTAAPTYVLFNIDHVISDVFEGECEVPGVTEGLDPVIDAVYFDHKPIVCRLGGDRPE